MSRIRAPSDVAKRGIRWGSQDRRWSVRTAPDPQQVPATHNRSKPDRIQAQALRRLMSGKKPDSEERQLRLTTIEFPARQEYIVARRLAPKGNPDHRKLGSYITSCRNR